MGPFLITKICLYHHRAYLYVQKFTVLWWSWHSGLVIWIEQELNWMCRPHRTLRVMAGPGIGGPGPSNDSHRPWRLCSEKTEYTRKEKTSSLSTSSPSCFSPFIAIVPGRGLCQCQSVAGIPLTPEHSSTMCAPPPDPYLHWSVSVFANFV